MQARISTGIGLAQLSARTAAQAVRRQLAALARAWHRLVGETYRPEKHYMRGPGPKWRAKHASAEAQAAAGLPRGPQGAARGR